MALMTVNDDDSEDFRSKPRWSAGKKLDAVLRLLRGESLDELSRELGVEAHRIAAWRYPPAVAHGSTPHTPRSSRLRGGLHRQPHLPVDLELSAGYQPSIPSSAVAPSIRCMPGLLPIVACLDTRNNGQTPDVIGGPLWPGPGSSHHQRSS